MAAVLYSHASRCCSSLTLVCSTTARGWCFSIMFPSFVRVGLEEETNVFPIELSVQRHACFLRAPWPSRHELGGGLGEIEPLYRGCLAVARVLVMLILLHLHFAG